MDTIKSLCKDKAAAAAMAGFVAAAGYTLYKNVAIPGKVVETEQHGGELVAQVFKAHGVEHVFTLVGGHISPILVASKASGIRVIDVRHEVTAVFAADAVARLTGVPGVAAVTAGPGLTNTITAVKNAQMAESPVVIISGAAATVLKGRGALQDIDQMSVLKPLVKFAATCNTVRDIVPTLRRAFQEAISGVPGPVFVEFPIDVLYSLNEIRANMGLSLRKRTKELKPEEHGKLYLPDSVGGNVSAYLESRKPDAPVFLKGGKKLPFVVDKYLKYKLRNLFSGAFDREHDVSPLPVHIPMPSSWQVSRVASMVMSAKRPVLIVASQATLFLREPDAEVEPINRLRDAVEKLGIPTFLSGMARGLLGRNNKLHIRQNRRGALREADLVILAGAVCDFRLDYGRSLSRKSKVVSINRNPKTIKMNSDLFWSPSVAALADPATFLVQLAHETGTRGWPEWTEKLKSGEVAKEESNAKKAREVALGRTGSPLVNPLKLVSDLEEVLPEKSILIGDGGDFIATASYIVRPRGPLKWLDPGAFGTLGVGGGFALGAKLCRPDHEVWLLWGDGSCGYSVAEYDTFKRHNVPIIALVGNDACWTQIEREQIPIFDDDVACPLEYTPYNDVAVGYGGAGLEIRDASTDSKAVFRRAQQLCTGGEAVLVNALIGSTNFREGSLSV